MRCEGLSLSGWPVDGNNNKLGIMRVPETLFWAAFLIQKVRHLLYFSQNFSTVRLFSIGHAFDKKRSFPKRLSGKLTNHLAGCYDC